MKLKTLLTFTAALGLAASANAQILVAGFHDGDALAADGTGSNFTGNVQLQSPALTDVVATLASTIDFTVAHYSQITDGLWGTTSLDVNPPGDLNKSILTSSSAFTLTFTLTNNGTSDLSLDQFHYSVKTDAPAAPAATLSYVAGGGLGASGASIAANVLSGTNGYDFAIGAGGLGLTDTILASGESAQFTWSTEASASGGIRIDNMGISAVPEASAAALIALAGLALLRRRR